MWLLTAAALAADPSVVRHTTPRTPPGPVQAARCLARVRVDAKGRPLEVEVRGCPEAFAESAREALSGWRWERTGQEATATVVVRFERPDLRFTPPAECAWDLVLGPDGALSGGVAPAPCAGWLPERIGVAAPPPPGTCVARFTERDAPALEGCAPEHEALLRAALAEARFANEPQVVSLTVPGEPSAPGPSTLAELRDGFPLGTKLRLRIEQAGATAREERWEVVGHTEAGCTIAATVHDPATGALVEDQGAGTSTWEELLEHARFPASRTEIADDAVTVPAGTFESRRYTVRLEDGSTKTLHFAKGLPGPPVSMVVERGGEVVVSMVLLERTGP